MYGVAHMLTDKMKRVIICYLWLRVVNLRIFAQ
jgi:hypothetical protein